MEARVTAQSQSTRLVKRMEEAGIHHAQEIRADLPGLRVIPVAGDGEAQLRFCDLGPIQVRAILNSGDGSPLPTEVLEGLTVPAPGTYDVLNARLSSNGDIRLVVDDQTLVRAVPTPARHREGLARIRVLWAELSRCSALKRALKPASERPLRDSGVVTQAARDRGRNAYRP